MSAAFEIQAIAVMVAAACSLPGVFLVEKKMSMTSDSITHTILLGIVLGFFITKDLSSPLLIIGAAAVGVATVWMSETLNRTRLLSEDASVGVVFPLLFSIAIILISRGAGSVHLDTDSVLLGELAFAPFERMVINGVDIGAKGMYMAAALLIVNAAVVSVLFKELTLATFDPLLAATLGFKPVLLHYGIMTMASLTAVAAFEAVGSILVVAFMIGPPVTAGLLSSRQKGVMFISVAVAALNGVLGYRAATALDASISGCMAVMTGITFLAAFIFAPQKGLFSSLRRRKKQKKDFACNTLLLHIAGMEEEKGKESEESALELGGRMGWKYPFICDIIARLQKLGLVSVEGGGIKLTEKGREESHNAVERLYD
ncbi:MAG: metal ABC transporter permease [Christensenellales bacterium]